MRVTLPYGTETVSFEVPNENYRGMLEPEQVNPAADQVAEIAYAIDHPVGCPPLSEIIGFDRRVNILCDDLTRPTPVKVILPVLIEKLRTIGVSDENIKVVMALGSHRYMTTDEMRERVGAEIYDHFRVENSEFKDKANLINLGTTEDGVEIEVSRTAMDSDIRIAVGNIVPHPVMGFSGGAKMLFPGVTGEKTVAQFHMLAGLLDHGYFGRDDSPIRGVIEKWAEKIGLHFIVNTVLTSELKVYKVVAGHYIKAQRAGVAYAKKALGCHIEDKADICVVSSYPSDFDMWQSGKGNCSGCEATKEKTGTVILVSPNFEGVGPHPEYLKFMGMDPADAHAELLRYMRGELVEGDPLALSVGTANAKICVKYNMVLVSDGVTREQVEVAGLQWYPRAELQKAVDDAIGRYKNPSVVSISHGSELFVY